MTLWVAGGVSRGCHRHGVSPSPPPGDIMGCPHCQEVTPPWGVPIVTRRCHRQRMSPLLPPPPPDVPIATTSGCHRHGTVTATGRPRGHHDHGHHPTSPAHHEQCRRQGMSPSRPPDVPVAAGWPCHHHGTSLSPVPPQGWVTRTPPSHVSPRPPHHRTPPRHCPCPHEHDTSHVPRATTPCPFGTPRVPFTTRHPPAIDPGPCPLGTSCPRVPVSPGHVLMTMGHPSDTAPCPRDHDTSQGFLSPGDTPCPHDHGTPPSPRPRPPQMPPVPMSPSPLTLSVSPRPSEVTLPSLLPPSALDEAP